jgi:predicted nucleotidyltransferase
MDSLRSLAYELGVPERTLRRAAADGLIRGTRLSPRRFRTTVRERDYLRRNWPLLSKLRTLLRTEPNVRLAVLYGSHASGTAGPGSDIDLLVDLRRDDVGSLAGLGERLSGRLGRTVQPVRLADAERAPSLLLDALEQGRVLADREGLWARVRRRRAELRRVTEASASLEDVAAALDLEPTRR